MKNAINDFNSSLELFVKSQNTMRIEMHYLQMGLLLYEIGDFENALLEFKNSYQVKKDINEDRIQWTEVFIIKIYYKLGLYEKCLDDLENLSKKIDPNNISNSNNDFELSYYIYLNLCKRALNEDYNNDMIDSCLKTINIDILDYEEVFHLYHLYHDKSYLEMAYNKINNEKLKSIEKEFIHKFLNYPIPKAILKEYNNIFETTD